MTATQAVRGFVAGFLGVLIFRQDRPAAAPPRRPGAGHALEHGARAAARRAGGDLGRLLGRAVGDVLVLLAPPRRGGRVLDREHPVRRRRRHAGRLVRRRPIKGLPVGAVFAWPGVTIGPIVNGAWGFGTALLLRLLPDRRPDPARA